MIQVNKDKRKQTVKSFPFSVILFLCSWLIKESPCHFRAWTKCRDFSSYLNSLQVKSAFSQYDINRDGKISKQELEDGMVQSGQFSFDDARTAFDIADINGDGEIDIGEFSKLLKGFTTSSFLGEFVQLMFPNAAEIVSSLKRNFNSVDDVERIFKTWDLNGDNAISFTELQVIEENSKGG